MANSIIDKNLSDGIKSAGDFLRYPHAGGRSVFVRLLGQSAQLLSEAAALDASGGKYIRKNALPQLTPMDDTAFYVSAAENIGSGAGIKMCASDAALKGAVSEACSRALSAFRSVKGSNPSVEKNFLAKLLFRLDSVFASMSPEGAKLVCANISKLQEYLFCYTCALLGADVLLLQISSDIEPSCEKLGLSSCVRVGEFSSLKLPEYKAPVRRPVPMPNPAPAQSPVPMPTPAPAQRPVPMPTPAPAQRPAPMPSPAPAQRPAPMPSPAPVRRPAPMPSPAPAHNSEPIQRPRNIGFTPIRRPQDIQFTPIQRPQDVRYTPITGVYEQRPERSYEELATLASSVVQILVIRSAADISPNGEFRPCSSGSGVMIGSDGYIVTNCHVALSGRIYAIRIENDDRIYCTDRLVKYHDKYDLAVLKIDRQLSPLPVYNGSRPLARGQKVVAIGSPLGMFNSISDGIISGFREVEGSEMIQFTAPISSGSSGGAVLNMYGDVIGISTAGLANEDGLAQNLNLAVSYKTIRSFCGNILQ